MLNKLKKWFFAFWVINYKVSFLLIFLIIISWFFSIYSIPKESNPDIKFWIISVSTIYPWVNPTDIDSLITEKIENEIKDIEWIKKITSSSSIWISSITVELNNWVNSRDAMTDIKDKVDTIAFPEDAEDPNVSEISTSSDMMFEALLYWPRDQFSDFFLQTKAKKIKSTLEWKFGISSIDIWWASLQFSWGWWWDAEYDIKVLISKEKLELLWISLNQISSIIRSYNKNTPIWNYRIWDLKYDFRFKWEFESINDLKNVIVRDNWTSKIRLSDIAEFSKEYDIWKINSLWFYNESDYNYIWLAFNKNAWTSIFKTSATAKEWLESYLNSDLDLRWLKIMYTKDMSDTITEDYWNLLNTWLQTLFFVFITILFFVWFRESLIASLLLPLSFFITFIVLDTLWFSMNFLTNFSLVLTLWIAIDTIIVIIEWASEKQKLWFWRMASILLSIRDLKAPLISWTMTTLAAFLPLIFLPWILWKFLSYIPITVFSTLLAALILSLTVSSALFLKLTKRSEVFHREPSTESLMSTEEKEFLEQNRIWKKEVLDEGLTLRNKLLNKLSDSYKELLNKFLHKKSNRFTAIVLPVVLLILTFVFLAPKIWFTIFPSTDNSVITIDIEAKTWTDKDSLVKYLPIIDENLSVLPEMKVYNTTISWNKISVYIELKNLQERLDNNMKSVFEIEEIILDKLWVLNSQWLKVESWVLSNWPPSVKPVWIKLISSDSKSLESLEKVSKEFEAYLKTIKWTKNVWTSSTDNPGQFIFSFDREKLSFVWLNPNDIIWEIYAYTNGIKAWSIKSEFEDNDIVLKVKDFDENLKPEDISNLMIDTKVWKIRVGDFVEYNFDKSLSSIGREDWKIVITVDSDLESWFLPSQIQPQLLSFAEKYNYPSWISFSAWWENSENSDLIISTFQSFFIALFLIFWILVFQFNSFWQPAIILYSVLLALLWVNIWLYVTWNPYSMPFAIWFIALTWVVVNDAIILVDRINKNLEKAQKKHWEKVDKEVFIKSIVLAWSSRLQPIIVTTLTTVFWVLPLALQDPFWAWLWFTIVFWLFAWSSMTLFVVPALYYVTRFNRFKK